MYRLLSYFVSLNPNSPYRRFPREGQVCLFPTRPILYFGYNRQALQQAIDHLQELLCAHGFPVKRTGEFDEATKRAVEQFQSANYLLPDGIVGPLSWAALLYPVLSRQTNTLENQPHIRHLQSLLCKEGFSIEVNGVFDRRTEFCLKRFQKKHGLLPDGMCGPMTWTVLLGQRQQKNIAPGGIFLPLQRQWHLLEPVLMVVFIYLGIHFSPWTTTPPFLQAVLTSYCLTMVVSVLLERLQLKILAHPILRYAPHVLTGFLWHPLLTFLKEALK
jgi:peptidoglycan hydrolase-like protein with peptidoglycan-binding domain